MLRTGAKRAGRIYSGNSTSFELPLNDLGGGRVNTAPSVFYNPFPTANANVATFTRNSPAYTTLADGTLTLVPANVARSYYLSPGVYGGYLAEGSRQNLALSSQVFADATYWGATNTNVTDNNTASPTGTTNASIISHTANPGAVVTTAAKRFAASLNTPYVVSIFAKKSTANKFLPLILSDETANAFGAYFNLETQAFSANYTAGGGSVTSTSVKLLPNGWAWYQVVGQTSALAAGVLAVDFRCADASGALTVTAGNAMYAWQADAVQASFASSPIPTTTVAVTRAADVLTYTTTGNMSATQGTVDAEFTSITANSTVVDFAIVSSYNGVASQGAPLMFGTSTSDKLGLYDGTAFRVVGAALSLPISSVRKVASSWGGSAGIIADTGTATAITFDGDMGFPASFAVGNHVNGLDALFGTIRNVRIWNYALSNAELKGMTT